MNRLIRKIELGKWRPETLNECDGIPADAITNCLNTTGNTLSIWKYEEDRIDDAILAIALCGNSFDTLDFVTFTFADLLKSKLETEPTEGDTFYSEYKNNHYNIYGLNYEKLGSFSEIVKGLILSTNPESKIRRTNAELTRLVAQGIVDGKIDQESLRFFSERRMERIDNAISRITN